VNRRATRTRRAAARRSIDTTRWVRLAVIAGASLLVLLTTCSSPTMPLRLSQAPLAPAEPERAAELMALPTVTPLVAAESAPAAISAGATPGDGALLPKAAPLPTPPVERPVSGPLAESIDRYLNDLVAAQLFHGAVLVARDGEVILSKGYGMADAEAGVPNGSHTRFRLASLTKQFTAMAVMILQARGQLAVDDPICGYLDGCPEIWQPITIRHLLNHNSGIVDYTDFVDFEPTEMNPVTPQQLVDRFRGFPLAFAPGTLYDYCNSNYVLLGLIIERVSGRSYPDFVRAEIFEPLGMRESGYDTNVGQIVGGAQGYTTFAQRSGFLDASTLYAAGGLYSTVEDLWLWTHALESERLVPGALLQAMFTPSHLGYGFGWKIERPNGRLRYSHAGDMTGVANFFAHYPEQRVTVVVLANMYYADAGGINNQIASMVFASP
jgi:CubicO group peptidase (beta-lactamase class C family)